MPTSKPNHLKTGTRGENFACEHLIKKGYRILKRNFRQTYGEIDIIARDRDGMLVFVEVKTMRPAESGLVPEDNISESKMRKTKKICEAYANHNPSLIKENKGWRIDVLAIELAENLKDSVVRQYENV